MYICHAVYIIYVVEYKRLVTTTLSRIERLAQFVVLNMAEVTQQQQQVRMQNLHCLVTNHVKCFP